jgi:hypothetical protein
MDLNGSMKARPGDVVQETFSGKCLIGRVLTTDPVRNLASVQLPYGVRILAEDECDVVSRRGMARPAEPTPGSPSSNRDPTPSAS